MVEGQKIEFKKSFADEDKILRTVCAFTNTKGGKIYIGINDNNKVVGASIGRNTLENFGRKIYETINPPVNANIEEIKKDSKSVVVITIPESEYKPHFYKGVAYKRVGKIIKQMDATEIRNLIKNELSYETLFDSVVNQRALIKDVDEKSLKKFVKKVGKKYASKKHALSNLKLLKNKKPLNAAILFFGVEPPLLIPMYGVKCAVFKNNEIKAMKDFTKNIFMVVDNVVDYILQQCPKKLSFKRAAREEELILPEEAVREAVINSLIHRDYSFPSAVHVIITNEKITIKNPGMLPSEIKKEDLYGPHSSKPRNPTLAQLAHMVGYIEHWGTGTLRIISSMRKAGLDDPVFEEKNGFFAVHLHFSEPKFNDRQKRILRYLTIDNIIKISALKKMFKVSDRTIRNDLKELIKKGFILKKEKGKNTYYCLSGTLVK